MDRVAQQKNRLREKLQVKRDALSPLQAERLSGRAVVRLKSLAELLAAKTIHTYVSWRSEVDTRILLDGLLDEGFEVIVPKVNVERHSLTHHKITSAGQLHPGTFGIPEPSGNAESIDDLHKIDLVIVPGVGFDLSGNRLGYGGGYYDVFLREIRAFRVGLSYDFQVVDALPCKPEDAAMDAIVTDKRVIRFGSGQSC